MKTKQESTQWYNGERKHVNSEFEWQPIKGNLTFCYSADQKQITIAHKENKSIGITFTEELQKRFDLYPKLLKALKSTKMLNLHLYEEGTIGNDVYMAIEEVLKETKK